MTFLHLLWLAGIMPWLGVALYLLWGRRKITPVPFLDLWRIAPDGPRVRRKAAVPPIALVFALAAMLLAVLAAGGPVVGRGRGGMPITVIVDRGIEMSARGRAGPRFREAADWFVREAIRTHGPVTSVDCWVVPGGTEPADAVHTDLSDLTGLTKRTTPTAADTSEALRRLVRLRLAETDGPVAVVSDADLGIADERVIQVGSETPLRNVGIVALAARASPRAQVMVRVRNDSPLAAAVVRVTTDAPGGTSFLPIQLPPAGGKADFFIGLPTLGSEVSAEVVTDDDQPADNRAFLAREAAWPRVEAAGPVGELGRLIELYPFLRPPSRTSATVRVVTGTAPLPPDAPGILAHPGYGTTPAGDTRPTRTARHPVTDAVADWPSLSLPLGTAEASPPGWTPILWAGDRPLVAYREDPARQLWVALDTDRWSNTASYVVFWSAAFDWVGRGGEVFASHPLAGWEPDWKPPTGGRPAGAEIAGGWPGIYTRADGTKRAFNAPAVRPVRGAPPRQEAARRLAAAGRGIGPRRHDAGPALLAAAVGCLGASAATWRRLGK